MCLAMFSNCSKIDGYARLSYLVKSQSHAGTCQSQGPRNDAPEKSGIDVELTEHVVQVSIV